MQEEKQEKTETETDLELSKQQKREVFRNVLTQLINGVDIPLYPWIYERQL